MFRQPFEGLRPGAEHEPEIGANRGKSDDRNADHHPLADQDTLHGAVQGSGRQRNLQGDVERGPVTCVIGPVQDASAAIPGEVDRQDRQEQHHPAEDAPDDLRVSKDLVPCKFGMGCKRIDQGQRCHHRSEAGGGQHQPDEYLARQPVEAAALACGDGYPEASKAGRTGGDVRGDQQFEGMVHRHGYASPWQEKQQRTMVNGAKAGPCD